MDVCPWRFDATERDSNRLPDSDFDWRNPAHYSVDGALKCECFPPLEMNDGTRAVPSRAVSSLVQTML